MALYAAALGKSDHVCMTIIVFPSDTCNTLLHFMKITYCQAYNLSHANFDELRNQIRAIQFGWPELLEAIRVNELKTYFPQV